jgi:Tol biopolymer transport system component
VRDVDALPVFSSDGQRIIYVRCNNPEPNKCRWLTADAEGNGEQVLAIREGAVPELLDWSPDGRRIAFGLTFSTTKERETIGDFDVEKKRESPLFHFADKQFAQPRWLPDSSGVLVQFRGKSGGAHGQVGYVSLPQGGLEPVTNDTNNYESLSLSADARTLSTIQFQRQGEIDMLAGGGEGPATVVPGVSKQLQTGVGVVWLNDSELLMVLPNKLLRVSEDGRSQLEVFNDTTASLRFAAVCNGGRTIVVTMAGDDAAGVARLWKMDTDGSNVKQITQGVDEGLQVCAPHGKWVYYFDGAGGRWMRVPVDGGASEALPVNGVPGSAVFPLTDVSRDEGKLVGFAAIHDETRKNSYRNQIAVIKTDQLSGPFQLVEPDSRMVANVQAEGFTPDGKALVYVISGENNVDNLWVQPLDGKPGRQLTHFTSDQIYTFAYSPDGKRLLVVRGHVESDVVLLRDTGK